MNLTMILQSVVYIALALVIVWVAKKYSDARTVNIDDDKEVEEHNNLAVGMRRAGLYFGLMIAMLGVLTGESQGFLNDIMSIALYGSLSCILLFIARWVNDKIILRNLHNDDECKNANAAVGIAELGSYIATGLIINGCIAGDDTEIIAGIIGTLIFFAIGQAVLVISVSIYEATTKFDCLEEILKKNVSVAVMIASKAIAIGLILRTSIMGPSNGLMNDITTFGISAGVGLAFLLAFNYAVDFLFLPNTDLNTEVGRDKNLAAVVLSQGAVLGLTFIITAIM